MKPKQVPDWQKFFDQLDEHYNPETFFYNQKYLPTDNANILDNFYSPTLVEETEIPEEGQLTVDIFQDQDNLYVVAPLAGVDPQAIEITVDKDLLTIKGKREKEIEEVGASYIYNENYWGNFSRSIILPVPVKENQVEAGYKKGVLRIKLPKADEAKGVKIQVKNLEE